MKVGLVLEGGGLRGTFTAGVLDVFLDEHIHIDGAIGVSAGALFGVNLPSKQKGRALRYNKKYAKDKRYMGLHSLLTTGNIVNRDFAYYELPSKLDPFDQQAFEDSGMDFWVTVTNVETGEPEYIKIDNVFEQMEAFRATSSMPIVSKIVEIEGKKYLDGGVSDSIPVQKFIEMGYDKIIVVLTRPLEYRKKPSSMWLFKRFYKKYPKLVQRWENRYAEYNQAVEQIIQLNEKQQIFVIRPSRTVKISRLETDVNKIQAMYDLGVEDAKNALAGLRAYLAK
ncbi:patatin-like phospholipase family protein [Mannheimia haemolytica]|uniref:patatin-like phospholipase family protein n=1 Tax=Mannheimia haemolytica TaxID=75985 RepID=UPI0001BCFA80|nr:patatin family protein [Mannheimia haemolytica]EEY13863.1 putative hydrolase [Mannheimia haemolytica serotype A2 str. BOVINE]MDW0722245.1 patatin family protein [Mannheimia haemolytica]MDW0735239.1 patatin family protein [Mannheimia haemolytica]TRC11629.1 patatin family protein [Mannheimia haemolytica]TRC65361.1 patatin family protein [Mannheimia haemolytica]